MAPSFRPPPGVRRELIGIDAREPRDERERQWQDKNRWLADNRALDGGKAPETEREYQYVISVGRDPGARGAWSMVPRSMPDSPKRTRLESEQVSLAPEPTSLPDVNEAPSPKRARLEAEQVSSAPEATGLPNANEDDFFQPQHGDDDDALFNDTGRNANGGDGMGTGMDVDEGPRRMGGGTILPEHEAALQQMHDEMRATHVENDILFQKRGRPETAAEKKSREQEQQFQADLTTLQAHANNPFALPLIECMQILKDKAIATATEQSRPPRVFEERSSSTAETDFTFSIPEILSIAPNDWDLTSWAPENVLDAKIDILNAQLSQHKAYIASISMLGMFVARDAEFDGDTEYQARRARENKELGVDSDEDPAEVFFNRNILLKRAAIDNAVDKHDPMLYPAGYMPTDTNRLVLVYNINQSHWVTVVIEVDEIRANGTVRLYNTLQTSKERGSSLHVLKKELPQLLSLIKQRPNLGWGNVNFDGAIPEVMDCPQQANTTDCGFWSIHLARQRAMSDDLLGGTLKDVKESLRGKVLRWDIMKDIYRIVATKDLDSPGPIEVDQALGDGQSGGSGNARKDKTKRSNKKSDNMGPAKRKSKPKRGQSAATDGFQYVMSKHGITPEEIDLEDGAVELDDVEEEASDDWRFDLRQLAYDIIEKHPAKTCSEDVILEEVLSRVEELAMEHDLFIDGQESTIRERTQAVLIRSPASFVRHEARRGGRGRQYSLNNGPGRDISTPAREILLSPPEDTVPLLDCIVMDFALIVSVVRSSEPKHLPEDFRRLSERATSQVQAVHNVFGNRTPMPEAIQSWADVGEEILDGSNPYWTDYFYSGSSTDVLLNPDAAGQRGEEGTRVRKLLKDANDAARSLPYRPRVMIAWSCSDGGSSNNDTWPWLHDEFESLQFVLVIVAPASYSWDRAYFRVNPDVDNCWAAFSVDRLAAMWQTERFTAENRESEYDDMDLPEYRFLTAATLVQYYKEDHSLARTHPELNVQANKQNGIAHGLSRKGRKTFELSEHKKQCEGCDVVADEDVTPTMTWTRGSSSDIAVVCEEHMSDALGCENATAEIHTISPVAASAICLSISGPKELQAHTVLENGDYKCLVDDCGKTFLKKYGLSIHQGKLHEGRTTVPIQELYIHICPSCGAKFRSARQLGTHTAEFHAAISGHKTSDDPDAHEIFPCTVNGCGKTFAESSGLAIHQGTHTRQNGRKRGVLSQPRPGDPAPHPQPEPSVRLDFICIVDGCGRAFATSPSLAAHMSWHSRKDASKLSQAQRDPPVKLDFACTVDGCGKAFAKRVGLAVHLAWHTEYDASKLPDFACTVDGCGRVFETSRDLARHLTWHKRMDAPAL